ncbi:hypothetical protein AB6E89_19735 [Vibrio breoganii]
MMSAVYVAQAITVVLFFLSPLFKDFILNNFVDASNIDFLISFRSRGISASGATVSVYLSFGFFYFLYLIGTAKSRNLISYSFIGIGLLLIAMFLSGRTGFLVFLVLVITFFIFFLIENGFTLINRDFIKRMFVLIIVLPLVFYLFYVTYGIVFSGGATTVWGEDKLSVVTKWVLDESDSDTSTVNFLLENHLLINTIWPDFLIGNPDFLSSYDKHTDIGYLRVLNDFGLVGFILYYSSLFVLFITSIMNNSKLSKFLLVGLMFCLFFVEAKEPFFHKHTIVVSYLFVVLLFGLRYKKESSE